jgi:hypothetical protein
MKAIEIQQASNIRDTFREPLPCLPIAETPAKRGYSLYLVYLQTLWLQATPKPLEMDSSANLRDSVGTRQSTRRKKVHIK